MADRATIEITGLDERLQALGKLATNNPQMQERIREAIRAVLKEARSQLAADASSGLSMAADPRQAYKAVRHSVYKRIFGGQLNILQKRKAGKPGNYEKPRKGLPKRGGNRWGRSKRTKELEGYQGSDRGFILRFLNAGTDDRMTRGYTDKHGNRRAHRGGSTASIGTHATGANRGNIAPRNWFGNASQKQLEQQAARLDKIINDVIQGIIY